MIYLSFIDVNHLYRVRWDEHILVLKILVITLLRFWKRWLCNVVVEQVTNRTALCRLLNGTCVMPANCAVLGLTLGYDYGRGSSTDTGKYFSCDDASTVCCYPFLVTSLYPIYTRHHGYHDHHSPHLQGFETVYEYWYPNKRQRQVT